MIAVYSSLLFGSGLTFAGSGGLVSSGGATFVPGFKLSPTGGALTGGSGPAKPGFKTSGVGGAAASGTAIFKPGFKLSATGGAVASGTSPAKPGFKTSGTGGAICGGVGSALPSYKQSAQGGLVAFGIARVNTAFRFSVTGGAVLAGAALLRASFGFVASGTVTVSGSATTSHSTQQQSAQPNYFANDITGMLEIPNFSENIVFSFPFIESMVDAIMATQPDTFTAGSVTTPCVFMMHDQSMLQGHVGPGQQMNVAYVLVKTADFPNLKRGDAVTVNGVQYVVNLPTRIQDGAVTQILLGKA